MTVIVLNDRYHFSAIKKEVVLNTSEPWIIEMYVFRTAAVVEKLLWGTALQRMYLIVGTGVYGKTTLCCNKFLNQCRHGNGVGIGVCNLIGS